MATEFFRRFHVSWKSWGIVSCFILFTLSVSTMSMSTRISLYLGHLLISNISISQTSPYLKHLPISNISLSQTSPYLKHLPISNITLSQTSPYLKHLPILDIHSLSVLDKGCSKSPVVKRCICQFHAFISKFY